jgi:tRNA pseudouridine55 synthase
MGDALGCGAHLARLRRTESGGFSLEEAISLDTLAELATAGKAPGCVLPMSDALRGVREVRVRHGLAQSIRYGQPVTGAELGPVEDESGQWIKITDAKKNLIAVLGARNRNGVYPYACVFTNNE